MILLAANQILRFALNGRHSLIVPTYPLSTYSKYGDLEMDAFDETMYWGKSPAESKLCSLLKQNRTHFWENEGVGG